MANVPSDSARSMLAETHRFLKEAQLIARDIFEASDEFYVLRSRMEENYKSYITLCGEQLKVSESVKKYNKAWLRHAQVNFESPARRELNFQVEALLQTLANWRTKLSASRILFDHFFRQMKAHITVLNAELTKLVEVKSLVDLANVSILNADWIEVVPDPKMETLIEEWDQLELQPTIQNVSLRMQQLTESDGKDDASNS